MFFSFVVLFSSVHLHPHFFPCSFGTHLKNRWSVQTGESIWIGNVELNILRKELKLEGLVVNYPDANGKITSKPAISIPKMHIEFPALFVKYIHLQNPQIEFEFYDNKFPSSKTFLPIQIPTRILELTSMLLSRMPVQITHDRGSLEWEDIDFALSKSQSSFQSSPLYIQMDA